MYIDALLADGADGSALVADLYFFALALKAALTLSSWSTSPCTLPRGAGCLGQGLCLRWPVSCVLDPFRARRECAVVCPRFCAQVGQSAREGRWPLSGVSWAWGVTYMGAGARNLLRTVL